MLEAATKKDNIFDPCRHFDAIGRWILHGWQARAHGRGSTETYRPSLQPTASIVPRLLNADVTAMPSSRKSSIASGKL
jgi:hypothetical protein